jgi:hypothetical protein
MTRLLAAGFSLSNTWKVARLTSVISSSSTLIACDDAVACNGLSVVGPPIAADALAASTTDATPTIPTSGTAAFFGVSNGASLAG